MAVQLQEQPGAIAVLVRDYIQRRGLRVGKLARLCDSERSAVSAILRGWYPQGSKALGLIARDSDEPLLTRLVRVLEIPPDEVGRAIVIDLGIMTHLPAR